jgi:tellurite resistance protein
MVEHGTTGAVASIAPYTFVAANLVVGVIAVATVRLMFQGRLLPTRPPDSGGAGAVNR